MSDITAAVHWYGKVLGLKHLYTFGNLAFFDCGGVRLFLSEGDGKPSESLLYFRVPDVRSAHTELAARRHHCSFVPMLPPHDPLKHADGTEAWRAFFKDTEERPLAIMAQVRVLIARSLDLPLSGRYS